MLHSFARPKERNQEKDALTLAIRASQSSHVRSLDYVLRQAVNFARAHNAPGSGYNSLVETVIKNKKELAGVAKMVLGMKPGIIALEGPLGAGKTAFTKELAKILGIKDEIISPTFVLHRQYGILNHIDCWRMDEFGELEQIGLKKMIDNKSLVVIEWAEKFRAQVTRLKAQAKVVWIKIEYGDKINERVINYSNCSN